MKSGMGARFSCCRLLLALVLFVGALGTVAANDELPEANVVRAIQEYQCFMEYWGAPSRRGKRITMTFTSNDGRAYAKVSDLESSPSVTRLEHIVSFLTVASAGMYSIVINNEGFNSTLPRTPQFIDDERKVEQANAKSVTIELWHSCPPFSPSELPLKQRVIQTIERTISNELSDFDKERVAHYQRELSIVIADFDLDYPTTYVMVNNTGEIFSVGIQGWLTSGRSLFPVQPVTNPSKQLRQNILRNGIIRDIKLDD